MRRRGGHREPAGGSEYEKRSSSWVGGRSLRGPLWAEFFSGPLRGQAGLGRPGRRRQSSRPGRHTWAGHEEDLSSSDPGTAGSRGWAFQSATPACPPAGAEVNRGMAVWVGTINAGSGWPSSSMARGTNQGVIPRPAVQRPDGLVAWFLHRGQPDPGHVTSVVEGRHGVRMMLAIRRRPHPAACSPRPGGGQAPGRPADDGQVGRPARRANTRRPAFGEVPDRPGPGRTASVLPRRPGIGGLPTRIAFCPGLAGLGSPGASCCEGAREGSHSFP